MPDAQPTIHLHLQRDGGILVLGAVGAHLRWYPLTLDHLQRRLTVAKAQGIVIEYSRDDPDTDPPKVVETIYKIIMSYEVPIKLLREPLLPPP